MWIIAIQDVGNMSEIWDSMQNTGMYMCFMIAVVEIARTSLLGLW